MGDFAKFWHLLLDPVLAVANKKLPGVETLQNEIDAPTLDADQPDTAFGYELPFSKGQRRGFTAGVLDNVNIGATVPALSALRNVSGLARGAKLLNNLNAGLDYTGMAAGGMEAAEGIAEGDVKRTAAGALMGGLSGVSRYTARTPVDPNARADFSFWEDHAQTAPPRPDDQLAKMFEGEAPVGPRAQAARVAATPAPTFAPAKPRPGQATLAPAAAGVIEAAPVRSAAQAKSALRDLNPPRQDAGVLPQARPLSPAEQALADEMDALTRRFDVDDDGTPLTAAPDPLDALLTPESVNTGVDPLNPAPIAPITPDPVTPPVAVDPVEPGTYDLGELKTPAATDDELAQLLRAERQSAADRGELDPDAELARMFEGEQNVGEQTRWDAARADAATAGDDSSVDPATRLAQIIAKRGGIKSTDDTILRKTRTSYKPKSSVSGELARVKDHGDGFGRWGDTPGVFRRDAGVHQDVMATDIAREFPEFADQFSTGDELLAYLEQLAINRNYRKPAPPRPIAPDVPPPVSDAVVDSQEALAVRDAASGNIRGDNSFPFGDETPFTPEVNAPDPARRKMLRGAAADAGDPKRLPPEPDLMEMLAGRKPPPVVDKFSNGEAQPRLPEAGAVRDIENVTPKVAPTPEQTFSLEPPRVKAPEQPTIPQALTDDVPTMRDSSPIMKEVADARAAEMARLRGTDADVPDNPVARQLEAERRAASAEAPPAPKASVPANVQAFLTKQLGYSPEAVAAMTPEQAITLGRAKTPPAEGQGATPKVKQAPAPSDVAIAQQPSPLSTRDVPIAKTGPRGQVAVDPAKAASSPDVLAQRATPDTTTRTTREKGINPRSIDRANEAGQKFVETGDPASLDAWAAAVAKEAEEAGASAVKGGYKESRDTGTRIHSNPLADPEMWKTAARVWNQSPTGRFLIGGTVGAYVGHEQDDPWSATAADFLTGAAVGAGINKNTAKTMLEALSRVRRGEGIYGARGVRPVVGEGGQRWKPGVDALSSPMRAIPELVDVQAKFEVADQAIRGFDAKGQPVKDFKGHQTPEDLMAATREALKAPRAAARKVGKQFAENAKKAYLAGDKDLGASERAKARYVSALLDRLENQPTLSAKAFGGGPRAQQADRLLADLQYGQALLWNFGLGRVLNKTQKYYALNYVPLKAIRTAKKAVKTDAGRKATDFLHIERQGLDSDLTDPNYFAPAVPVAKRAKEIWNKVIERTGGNALKASDEQNRRVTYLAATEYAKSKGGVQTGKGFDKSPEAIHRWAMDVTNATQGAVGPMGQSPYISRLGKAATTFTKFSGLTMELALDIANKPRPETIGALGVLGSLMALNELAIPEDYQLDLWKMLGAKVPVSFTYEGLPKPPSAGQFSNFWDQLTNDTQSLPERAVRALALPDAPERYIDEIFGEGGFLSEGMGTHRHPNRYGSLDEHSGYDALARMFGVETEKNSERILESQQQRNFARRTTEESAAKNRPARQKTRIEKLKKSKPGAATTDDIRSRVPVKARPDYDKRFGARP